MKKFLIFISWYLFFLLCISMIGSSYLRVVAEIPVTSENAYATGYAVAVAFSNIYPWQPHLGAFLLTFILMKFNVLPGVKKKDDNIN